MKSSFLHRIHLIIPFLSQNASLAYICEEPINGCANGMFSQEKCECECIEPFCPNTNGGCTVALNNCGGNPWQNCEKGVNCPWWVNVGDPYGSCSTGSKVPLGRWQIYNNREACCDASFPSNTNNCSPQRLRTRPPTKRPTIHPYEWEENKLYYQEVDGESGEYEPIIPLRIDVKGLSDSVQASDLKEDLSAVLTRILRFLSEKMDGLTVLNVEEKAEEDQGRILRQVLLAISRSARKHRVLQKEFSLYYNIKILRDENENVGPLMISELRKRYAEVLDQIQIYSDYLNGEDIELNFCTMKDGSYSNCVFNAYSPLPVVTVNNKGPTTHANKAYAQSDDLDGWAIFPIVFLVIVTLCCIGSLIIHFCYRNKNIKGIEYNSYFDDRSRTTYRKHTSRRSRRRSRRSRHSIAEKNDEVAVEYESSHPRDTYSNNKRRCRTSSRLESRSRGSRSSRHSRHSSCNIPEKHDEYYVIELSHPQDPRFDDDSFGTNDTKLGKVEVSSVANACRRYYYVELEPRTRTKGNPTKYIDDQSCCTEESSSNANHSLHAHTKEQYQGSVRDKNELEPSGELYLGGNSIEDSHRCQPIRTDCITGQERSSRRHGCSVDPPVYDIKRETFEYDSEHTSDESADSYVFEKEGSSQNSDESVHTQDEILNTLSVSCRSKKSRNSSDKSSKRLDGETGVLGITGRSSCRNTKGLIIV